MSNFFFRFKGYWLSTRSAYYGGGSIGLEPHYMEDRCTFRMMKEDL